MVSSQTSKRCSSRESSGTRRPSAGRRWLVTWRTRTIRRRSAGAPAPSSCPSWRRGPNCANVPLPRSVAWRPRRSSWPGWSPSRTMREETGVRPSRPKAHAAPRVRRRAPAAWVESSSSASPGGVSANVDANRTASGAASTNAADADAAGTASGQVVLTGEVHLGRAAEFTPTRVARRRPRSRCRASRAMAPVAPRPPRARRRQFLLRTSRSRLRPGRFRGVSGAVGSSVTNVGTTVVATLNQLASNVPATTPVGEALSTPGATVSGRGQSSGI